MKKTLFLTCCLIFLLSTSIAFAANTADEWVNIGQVYLENSEYDKALEAANSAISLDHKNAAAYNLRGFLLGFKFEEKLYYDAITDFAMAIELDPQFHKPYHNRGFIYADIGSYDKAIADLTMAIKYNHTQLDLDHAYAVRGATYLNQGRYDSAMDDFNKALEISHYYAGGIFYCKAFIYENTNRIDLAIEAYIKATECPPPKGSKGEYINLARERLVALGYE